MAKYVVVAIFIAVGIFLNNDKSNAIDGQWNSSGKVSISSEHRLNKTTREALNSSAQNTEAVTSRPGLSSSSEAVVSIGFILKNDRKLYNSLLTAVKRINANKYKFVGFVINPEVKLVNNSPYDTLQALCETDFSTRRLLALVFICGDICTDLATLASYSGMSLIRITEKYHRHGMDIAVTSSGTILDMIPPLITQNDALVYLLQKFQWRTVCLMHDTTPWAQYLAADLRRRQKEGNFQIAWEILINGGKGHVEKRLKKVKGKSRVFILFSGHKNAEDILRKATALNLTERDYAWLLSDIAIDHSRPTPESFPEGLLAVEYDHGKQHDLDHMEDTMELLSRGIGRLKEAGQNLTDSSMTACSKTDISERIHKALLYREMKKDRFKGQTGVVSFTDHGQRLEARYTYLNLRRQKETRKLQWENVGYTENNDLSLEQILWPGGVFVTPSGLPRVLLRVVTYEVHPLMFVRDLHHEASTCLVGMDCTLVLKQTGGTEPLRRCCYGMCVDLLDKLSKDLTFEPELVVIQHGMGGALKSGKWTGLIGEVVSGRADLAMASISITEQRSQYVDFSEPYIHTGSTILVAKQHGSFAEDGFLKPFRVSVWLTIFGLLYIVAFLIFILETKNLALRSPKYKANLPKFDISDSIWLTYSRLFSGILSAKIPAFVSSRVVLSFWAFLSLIVFAKYTANLAAFMVLRERTKYIEGINDPKMQQPSKEVLKFTTISNTSVEDHFERNYPEVHKFMKNYRVKNSSEGVKAVISGEIDAFIWEEVSLRQYVSRDPTCSLLTVGKLFDMNGYGIALQKDSQWTKPISDLILEYQQTSALDLMLEKWRLSSCNDMKEELSMGSLGETNFLGVFYLLMAGVVFSGLILAGEYFYYWCFFVKKIRCENGTMPESIKTLKNALCTITARHSKKNRTSEDETSKEFVNLAPFLSELEKDLSYLLRGVRRLHKESRNSRSQDSSSDSYSSDEEPQGRKSLSTMRSFDSLRVALSRHETSQLTLANIKRLVNHYKVSNTRDRNLHEASVEKLSVV